jgi:methylated-DNA-[protein]-cysteine S-methyltransferase
MNFNKQTFESPVGPLILIGEENFLCGVIYKRAWLGFKNHFEPLEERESKILEETKRQLAEYFSGQRKRFDLPHKLTGTSFQNRVWASLGKIPFGETRTYKEQASAIGSPGAARAIGRSDGLNPICIVLPCHRVVGSDGALTGYSGGLEAKRFLLELEKKAVLRQ